MLQLVLAACWATTARAFWGFGGETSHQEQDPSIHKFTLRHLVHHSPDVRLYDVPLAALLTASSSTSDGEDDSLGPFTVRSSTTKIERLVKRSVPDVEDILSEARWYGKSRVLPASAWTLDEVPSPNVTDRDTVISFAVMAANAYQLDRKEQEWENPLPPFNFSDSFGWKGDSLRGHVFANEDNSTIVLAIKGTSAAVFDGAETTHNDKVNDNLFFSCCCGQGGQIFWLQVCECMTSAYTCNQTCVISALKEKNRYYSQVLELYGNVTEYYPNAQVWATGHSLGGAVASLLGLTFGLPTLTFEAVPEALPAARLGLPIPPSNTTASHQARKYTGAWHFGHTADPVYQGTCNSANAFCTLAGYAMESQCRTGHRCAYDTVGDLKWRQSMLTHGIKASINDVYRKYKTLPNCTSDAECVDCAAWKYYDSNHTDTTTSKAKSTSTTTSLSTSTTTCQHPGWFGCNDPTTTVSSSTVPVSTYTSTLTSESCASWGWFGGCKQTTSVTVTVTSTVPITTSTSTTTSQTTCVPGIFYGCKDQKTKHSTSSPEQTSAARGQSASSKAPEVTPAPHLSL